jgi:hypothetical protein
MMRVRRRRWAREYEVALERRASEPTSHDGELTDLLDGAVTQLPKTDRTAVILRFYQGLSFEEMARTLEVSEAAARKRVARGIERLRQRLGVCITESALFAVVAHGLSECPAELSRSASVAALSAHAAANASAMASPAKGIGYLMASANTKVAISLAGIILAISVGAVMLSLQWFPTSQEQTASRPSPASTRIPPGDAGSGDLYVLRGDEALRRLANPQTAARRTLFAKLAATGLAGDRPAPAVALIIGFKGTSLQEWSWDFNNDFTLSFLLEYLLRFYPQQVEGDYAAMPIPGDFVFDVNASTDPRRLALQKILQDELREPIALTERAVLRNVIVLHGKWRFTPSSSPRAKNNIAPDIEFYEHKINPNPTNAGAGDSSRFAGELGKYIGRQVIVEAANIPSGLFWSLNDTSEEQHDAQLVLDHVKEQTNLAWDEEARTVERIFIEPCPLPQTRFP